MNEAKHSRRDFWQNIAIVALSLSAVILFAQTQLYNLASTTIGQYLDQLLETPAQAEHTASTQISALSHPVHVAVTGVYGRFGDMTMVTSGETFRPLNDLLKEALGSARVYTVCSEGEFLESLNSTSIYYDFLTSLPLSVLADTDTAATGSGIQARRLILSDQGERGVQLYIQDSSGTYQYCSTAVSRGDLESAADGYELGNAVFAFELAKTDSTYASLDPCSLFLSDVIPSFPVLQASQTPADSNQLLTALSFNPRTNYRYPESDGTEVIVEGERSLRIRPDGTLLYRSGGETALTIDTADPDLPTMQEAAAGSNMLLQKLMNNSGDGQLYLQSIQQVEDTTVLQFDYHAGSIPIRFSDGSCAAEVTLTGSTVSALTLRFRQYAFSGESSLLLPLRQALAIAVQNRGTDLSIGYADNGTETLAACWLTE